MSIKKYLKYILRSFSDKEFTFSEYKKFLKSLLDDDRFKIVPLQEFRDIQLKDKIVISLRHDVDDKILHAVKMANIEFEYNIRSTYYILHTAGYYGITKRKYARHNKKIIPILKKIQNEYHHEIGWHNDLLSLYYIFDVEPKSYLHRELGWLMENGIEIVGTASHGSPFCGIFNYRNFNFFADLISKVEEIKSVKLDNVKPFQAKENLLDYGFKYEAYHLDNNYYFSDSSFKVGKNVRWHPKDLDLLDFKLGDKIIILIHPEHWCSNSIQKWLKPIDIIKKSIQTKLTLRKLNN